MQGKDNKHKIKSQKVLSQEETVDWDIPSVHYMLYWQNYINWVNWLLALNL